MWTALMGRETRPSVAEIVMMGERRVSERVFEPFWTIVQGVARTGEPFSIETVVDNISEGGFYVRLPLEMAPGERVRAIISFTTSPTGESQAPRLWISGEVLRVELLDGGCCGTAVSLNKHRFLQGGKFRSAFTWARKDA